MLTQHAVKTGKKPSPSSIVVTSTLDDIPVELCTMNRWIKAGPAVTLETEVRTTVVDKDSLTPSQNLMFRFKSKRQVTYKSHEDAGFWSQQAKENPQVLGLALTTNHDTRNKKPMDLLNAQGYSVSYSNALIVETTLANAVVENTKQFQGTFIEKRHLCSLPQTTQTLLRTRVPHIEQSLPPIRRLMHLVNQSHHLYALVTERQRVSW